MKRFILLVLFLLFISPCNAQIITGEVEYNTNSQMVSGKQTQKISFNKIRNHFFDSNNVENLNYLFKGITELKDRKLARFSDGSYGVQYYDDPLFSWYYSSNGKLINFIQKDTENYPSRFTKFKPDGSVSNTGYRISQNESYIYDKEGKLLAHWIGNNCYDENSNIIMTRKIMD